MPRGWCRYRYGPGRPMKPRFLAFKPSPITFVPFAPSGPPITSNEPIYLSFDEYEAIRLTYIEGLNQEDVAKRMKISRGTVWRCLENARKNVARMIVERRPLIVASEPSLPPKEPGT